ncbi:MAG: SHOCT domain-containing protein [Microlunatus sp.]|nr:SHOCT domain-containing protein [Microlunatus sp.]MDN5769659.1 SHOCT domain-containing protein [Microlunatus sp.]
MDDKIAQLKELGELRAAGVLTDAEFEGQKAKILGG